MLAAGSALVTAVAVRPAGVMERDAKNDEVSQNSYYGVSPAEGPGSLSHVLVGRLAFVETSLTLWR